MLHTVKFQQFLFPLSLVLAIFDGGSLSPPYHPPSSLAYCSTTCTSKAHHASAGPTTVEVASHPPVTDMFHELPLHYPSC